MAEDTQIESMVTITGAEYVRLMAENAKLRAELNARCPVDAMDRGMSPVEAAVYHVWGERCPDFEPECLTCKAWAEYDEIERLRAALHIIAWEGYEDHDFQRIARAVLGGDNG